MTTAGPGPLEATTWRLVAVLDAAGRAAVPDGVAVTLHIAGDRFTLQGACNRGGGGIDVDGDVLRIATVAMTRMACEPARMQLDHLIVDSLTRTPTFRIDGDRLHVVAGGQALEFHAAG
jgi:heat shock protein HslJ